MDWGFEPVFWAFLQVPGNNRQREPQLQPHQQKRISTPYSELGGLTLFSGQLGRSNISPTYDIFQFMAVGLLGMESTIKWRNRRRTNVWTPPSHIPAESPKTGSESQGAFPKSSSKDSAGLAP